VSEERKRYMPDNPTPPLAAWVENSDGQQQLKWLGHTRLRVLIEEPSEAGDGSPLHVHRHEDELFWVLQGAMTAWIGDERHDLTAGGFAFLPRNIPHAHQLTADRSRLLIMATPAGIEDMFREAGWDLATPPPPDWSVSMPLLAAICDQRGTPILGPPPELYS
jgi:mannose-6-phosphate isomerase-like protein (cupin superfamily)